MVAPMLLKETTDMNLLDANYIFQVKEDGCRCVIHVKEGKVTGIFDRREKPISRLYPEIRALEFPGVESAIIDGEITVQVDGKSKFYEGINQRSHAFYPERVETHPVTFIPFDILYLNGKPMVATPYKERLEKLTKLVTDAEHIRMIKTYQDGREAWKEVLAKNLEGVVIKTPNGLYDVGGRSNECLKLKNYKTAMVTVISTESNSRGTKIYGECEVDGEKIEVEAQIGGVYEVDEGATIEVTYLNIVRNKNTGRTSLRMPHLSKENKQNSGLI
jgi:ATP-dependent DNA ligase